MTSKGRAPGGGSIPARSRDEQTPDQRIAWMAEGGPEHAGVVTSRGAATGGWRGEVDQSATH